MTAFPTGNLHRDGAIIAVLRELISEGTPTFSAAATLCNRYGASFDGLSSAEFNEALTMLRRVEAVGEDEVAPVEPVDQEPEADLEMTQEEVRVAINEQTNLLALDRQALQRALIEQKKAADALAQKIYAWTTGGEKLDHVTNVKQWAASNQAQREGVANHTIAPPQRNRRALRSVVDRTAAYSHGGDANDFARLRPPMASLNGRIVPIGTPGSSPGTKGFRRGAITRRTGG
jgi:hypothetical protein